MIQYDPKAHSGRQISLDMSTYLEKTSCSVFTQFVTRFDSMYFTGCPYAVPHHIVINKKWYLLDDDEDDEEKSKAQVSCNNQLHYIATTRCVVAI